MPLASQSAGGQCALPLPLGTSEAAREAFERVFRRLRTVPQAPAFDIEFRPFAGLRSQITLRDGRACVRLSDLFSEAPAIVVEALAEILLARVYRLPPSPEARRCYLSWVCNPAVRERSEEIRRARGRPRVLPPQGKYFDLDAIFSGLNRRFFNGDLPTCRLGWTPRASRTVLGRYDPAHRAIIVSKSLDAASVPRYVVEYLVFHEMLHARFPLEWRGCRRVIHSSEFRAVEKRFPHYHKARARLKHAFA